MLDFIDVNTHSSIRLELDQVLYVDPFHIEHESHDADIIFITHSHYDHLSPDDIRKVSKTDTILVCPESVREADNLGLSILKVGTHDQRSVKGVKFETIPAYNKLKPFHPRSKGWIGYIINSRDQGRIYIAGDTDITDENKQVKCRIAMLPIGGTFTIDAKQAAKLANIIKPEYVIPVHYGSVAGKPEDADTFAALVDSSVSVVLKVKKY